MSQNPKKVVIAPEMGMGDSWLKDEKNSDFLRDDMIRICVNSLEKR